MFNRNKLRNHFVKDEGNKLILNKKQNNIHTLHTFTYT